MSGDQAECPSCEGAFERGPDACPLCGYEFAGDINDSGRALRYRQERMAKDREAREEQEAIAAREWADSLPPSRDVATQAPLPPDHGAKPTGWLLLVAGIFAAGAALLMDVTVDTSYVPGSYGLGLSLPESVVNIDKVATRDMVYTTGVGLILLGAMLVIFGSVMDAIEGLKQQVAAGVTPSRD